MSDSFHKVSGVAASHAKLARAMNLPRAGCANGLYTAPSNGGTYDSLNKLTVSWDTTCFDPAPQTVDIKLSAPLANKTAIHTWKGALYSSGTIDLDLLPRWWNSTSSISMQVTIVEDSDMSFLTDQEAGPIFTVTYDASKAATQSGAADAANTSISDEPESSVNDYKASGLSKGALAAAILIPLLVVISAVVVYVVYSRKKETQKRKRWSEKVDQRMSYISGDWRSMSGSAANAAIRQSMAASGGRTSGFFAGNGPHPRSSMASDYPNTAGVGANKWMSEQDMSPVLRRPQLASTNPAARISTVSFANDPRPSGERGHSIYDRQSMFSNYNGSSKSLHKDVPPVPRAAFQGQQHVDDMEMSPTQTEGAMTLSPDEIRSRIHNGNHNGPDADVLPALALMRTGQQPDEPSGDYLVQSPKQIGYPDLPPGDAHAGMVSPPPAAMSPDQMLAAYASQKRSNTTKGRKASTPGVEATSSANGGMRVLYAPSNASSGYDSSIPVQEDPYAGMDEDAYSGYSNNSHLVANPGSSYATGHYSAAASYGSAYSTDDPFKQVERR